MTDAPLPRRPLDGERIDRRLARVRALYARWATLRPGDREVWRSGFTPLTEAEVARTEARLGLRLPENYRRYLLEFGDPGQALMSYAGRPFERQGGARSAEPFPLDGPWAGSPIVITAWEDEEGGDFFEDGPGEFHGWLDDPEAAFYELPDGAQHHDGTLLLGATRSHFLARLVLNGPWAGTVWFDSFGCDGGLIHPADDSDDPFQDYTLGAFFDAGEWRPLVDQPWFPGPEEEIEDPAPADFLDLTLAWLRHRVRQAEAERTCDLIDAATLAEAARRLRTPHAFGFPRGHTYGSFAPYVAGLMRDELLRPAPDRALGTRIVELARALLGPGNLPVALILAGRWQELADLERNTFPDDGRSAVNLALAEAMLGTAPTPSATVPTRPGPQRTGTDRWAVLDTVARVDAARRRRFLERLPEPDAAELRPLLATATQPVDAAALDAVLAGDLTGPHRDAATVLLVRTLHAMAVDGGPATATGTATGTGMAERVCALAVATDRVGDVFDLLTAVTGGRWADWHAAREDGQRFLATLRPPRPVAEAAVPERQP
ncbi:SMI1/KNR4 family protein [Streptomyces clavuligerus]|uniref:SMI1_KNR4 domain-containing protein n=1 Tax=Streptomyces clavuligerus TaxID=1901 RepID=D5SLS8_STRCL|nr:SMI1/KNR4 family protein [Streptomyces clavuligerus]EFG04871.1 SMI1_KNR4 domain-containing protein [Streptomyces clavuligerus]MBY6306690.1 SMI1/KNR4 family protein [Streptomyces clavuligerus]QCS10704.1 SMI1/KNR4 family protein [Streptomyces clavuligerus]QPJ97260.1 SMI1/KNR4 family protein [Streptomyces clavuligerus]WDN57415.1 SMI1/KNR4 family protein [Streptomyces clavuligerus]